MKSFHINCGMEISFFLNILTAVPLALNEINAHSMANKDKDIRTSERGHNSYLRCLFA